MPPIMKSAYPRPAEFATRSRCREPNVPAAATFDHRANRIAASSLILPPTNHRAPLPLTASPADVAANSVTLIARQR
jgi:hypothetical protein